MWKKRKVSVLPVRFFLIITAVFLMICWPATVMAEEFTINLEANSRGFVEGEFSFDWNNLNPGDTITKTIRIINNHNKSVPVAMKAERISVDQGGQSEEEPENGDLLDNMELTLTYQGQEIYKGPASGDPQPDNTGNLIGGIDLGSIPAGETYIFEAKIYLDGEKIGNEFQGDSVQVNWVFTGQFEEEQPSDRKKDKDREKENEPDPIDEPIEVEPEDPVSTPEDPTEPITPEEPVITTEEPSAGTLPAMPKTGEDLPYPYYIAGAFAIVIGAGLIRNKKS